MCFISAYILSTNTKAWGRAKRLNKYKFLINLVISEKVLIKIATQICGEDEPAAYAILKMRRQDSLQKVLEYYNDHNTVYAFKYGAGKDTKIYTNTSGATTWTGVKSLWAVLNKIDKEHFIAALQKNSEPRWIRNVEHCNGVTFVPVEKGRPKDSNNRRIPVSRILTVFENKYN